MLLVNVNNFEVFEFESKSKLQIISEYLFDRTSIEQISIPSCIRKID